MKYYPIYLNLQDRPCVVIGGGDVGWRKAERLLDCGARVTVVSPVLTPTLQALGEEGRIRIIGENYAPNHLEGAFLVIGATNREEVNERICRDCRKRGILVNIVDDPPRCDFILPALCERGDLSLAVSTAGKSPALAKRIRQEMETAYGNEYGLLLSVMGRIRERLLEQDRPQDDNRRIFEALLDSPLLDALRQGRWDQASIIVRDIAGVDMEPPGRE